MSVPRVSVITIVRNDQAGLKRTQESVMTQSMTSREWIVIDGASNDGTERLAEELFAAGIAAGVSERDQGIYDAMNKGLDRATGDYVLFLNAGDRLLDETSLQKAVQRVDEADSPDIAFFSSIMDFGTHTILRPVKAPSYIWHGQPGLHQATLFKRSLHNQHRFTNRYKVCGDYDTLARMSKSGVRMCSFDDVINVNTFDKNAMSGKNKLRLSKEALEIQKNVLKLPVWKYTISVARRSINSMAFKIMTMVGVKG